MVVTVVMFARAGRSVSVTMRVVRMRGPMIVTVIMSVHVGGLTIMSMSMSVSTIMIMVMVMVMVMRTAVPMIMFMFMAMGRAVAMSVFLFLLGGAAIRSGGRDLGVGVEGDGFFTHRCYSTPWGYYRVKHALGDPQ